MKWIGFLVATLLVFKLWSQDHSCSFEFELFDNLTINSVSKIKAGLEKNANRIMNDLDVRYTGVFNVHIWNNQDNYLTAQQKNIGASYPGSTGYVYGPNDLALLYHIGVEQTAVHEFAHCVSLHVSSSFGNNPRWLWEAVAIYESGQFVDPKNINYLVSGNYPSINELNSNFNNGNYKIYEVGYLIAEFIITDFGKSKLIELIKKAGNVQTVLEISVSEFEKRWKEFVQVKYFGKNPTGIRNQPDKPNIQLFPNPTRDEFQIYFGSNPLHKVIIQLVNNEGKKIFSANYQSISGTLIDIRGFPKGIYIVKLIIDGISYNQKLCLE